MIKLSMAYYLRVLTSTLLVLSVYASVTASGSASQQRDGAAQARGPDRKRDGPATDHLASAVPLRSSIESRDVGQAALRQDSVFRDVVDDGKYLPESQGRNWTRQSRS